MPEQFRNISHSNVWLNNTLAERKHQSSHIHAYIYSQKHLYENAYMLSSMGKQWISYFSFNTFFLTNNCIFLYFIHRYVYDFHDGVVDFIAIVLSAMLYVTMFHRWRSCGRSASVKNKRNAIPGHQMFFIIYFTIHHKSWYYQKLWDLFYR